MCSICGQSPFGVLLPMGATSTIIFSRETKPVAVRQHFEFCTKPEFLQPKLISAVLLMKGLLSEWRSYPNAPSTSLKGIHALRRV